MSAEMSFGELSARRNVLAAKCSNGEMSRGEMSGGEMSGGEMSGGKMSGHHADDTSLLFETHNLDQSIVILNCELEKV